MEKQGGTKVMALGTDMNQGVIQRRVVFRVAQHHREKALERERRECLDDITSATGSPRTTSTRGTSS